MNSRASSKLPKWLWLMLACALAALVIFLVILSRVELSQNEDREEALFLEPFKTPTFEFYHILEDSEIPVSEPAPGEIIKPIEDLEYLLQVASYRSFDEAKDTQRKLVYLGLPAKTEVAKLKMGNEWNRVIVGPFESRSKLQKARNILLSNRYEAMLLQRKKATDQEP